MSETQSGLTNAQYATWLSNTASLDCSDVEELYIKLTSGSENRYTNNSEICEIMSSATAEQVSSYQELKFSGHDPSEEPWYAIDKRVTINLERTVNYGDIPINIRRPTGS